jgi:hypothetical protein
VISPENPPEFDWIDVMWETGEVTWRALGRLISASRSELGTGFESNSPGRKVSILHPLYARRDGRNVGDNTSVFDPAEAGFDVVWKRVSWSECLSERRGGAPLQHAPSPSDVHEIRRALASELFEAPSEGSVDDPIVWSEMIRVIASCASGGYDSTCHAFYTPWKYPDRHFAFSGTLQDAAELATLPFRDASPQNLWSTDLSWILLTDNDALWTEVGGSEELISALSASELLETSPS